MADYHLEDGLLYYRKKVYVPQKEGIKRDILRLYHDSMLAGHPGRAQTLELVERGYYWPSMKMFINLYIQQCVNCQQNKNRHTRLHGKLQPLPIPEQPWKFISYDYIPDLPESNGFNAILVVVDRFTKMAHFVPARTNDTAEITAMRIRRNIWRLHGLPTDTVSDRGPQFNAALLRGLYEHLGIKPRFSTAFHPETDGQTERTNATLEAYLRMYTGFRQDDWEDYLDVAEFAYNNREHTSTGVSPFFANYGFHPVFTTVPTTLQPSSAADTLASRLSELHVELRATLGRSVEQYARFYDRKHGNDPAFNIGDKVWLESVNLTIDRVSPKLSPRRLGPFRISARVGNSAYRLDLPAHLSIHPVFHISLLSPYHAPGSEPAILSGGPSVTNGTGRRIESILSSRVWRQRLQYHVTYVGLDRTFNEWVDAYHVPEDQFDLVDSYHQRHPRAPAPTWLRRTPRTMGARGGARTSGALPPIRLPGLGLRPPPLAGATVMTSPNPVSADLAFNAGARANV